MASASSDKTSSTSNSKSTGGGYYTNDFKPSGKKDATPDKSSSKSVSLKNIQRYMLSFHYNWRLRILHVFINNQGPDRGYTTSQSATSKSSSHATKDRHRNSSSSRTGTSDRGSYRSRSRERNERLDTKKR